MYIGSFVNGKRNGEGLIKFLNQQKDIIYYGSWLNGFKDGFGRQIEANDV